MTATRSRLGWQGGLVMMMTLAAFGPYINGSIRTEQAIVYVSALIFAPLFFRLHPPPGGTFVLFGLAGVLGVAIFGVLLHAAPSVRFLTGEALSGLDNMALPVAVLSVVWSVVKDENADNLLLRVGKLIAWLVAGNAVIAIISTRTDLAPTLRPFWAKEDPAGALVTADLAAQLGRFSGIFNQPAEAGVVYGLAALLTIYCYKDRRRVMFLLLTLILLGGLISVSKTFILCGLPIALFYLWRSHSVGGRLGMVYTLPILALGVVQAGIFQGWSGSNFLGRLLSPPENKSLVEFYSAGRFGSASDIGSVASEVLSVSPITGVGAQGWQVAYDSGVIEVLVIGGVLGLAFHVLTFVGLWVVGRRTVDSDRRSLALCLCVMLIGADLGLPALTANRVATLVWVVVGLLALAARQDRANRGADELLVAVPPDSARWSADRQGAVGDAEDPLEMPGEDLSRSRRT